MSNSSSLYNFKVADHIDSQAPLDLDQAFTLAKPLIKSCPPGNPKLPIKAFPPLAVPASAEPGQTVEVSFEASNVPANLSAAFISGLNTTFVPVTPANGTYTVDIPSDLLGVVYIVITSDGKKLEDKNTIAGPQIVIFAFDDQNKLIPPSS
jgi:hypothetical protein